VNLEDIVNDLDDDQRQVVETLGVPVGVIAGAGTGKTRTLTRRITYGAHQGLIEPGATLAVTFTTSAAKELRQRLESLGVAQVQTRTFHSAALRQAQYFWPQAYNAALPALIDHRSDLLKDACQRLGLPSSSGVLAEIDLEISWTKQNNVLIEDYLDHAQREHRTITRLDPQEVCDVMEAYEEAKQGARVIDYDDLLLCAVALLSAHEDITRQVRHTYRHLYFDEYQDISPIQARLVDLWLGDRDDVCVVGDPAQTIHHFAGSRSIYLENFGPHHDSARCFTLTNNYRSTPEILALANRLTTGIQLQAQNPSGDEVEFSAHRDTGEELTATAVWLKSHHQHGVDYHDMAVLFRTHAQVEEIGKYLGQEAIPFVFINSDNLDNRPGVRIGTLHASKGMEWLVVALCGLQEGCLPHPLATSSAAIAEEKRLLYVGVTRARQGLRLSWSRIMRGHQTTLSRFLEPIVDLDST